ncbi:MAG: YegS/Rv2252/BmrU family lipid kinase [Oscillospiraceae bacterium]|nr:YegS/Rv2252/BmrU family lipid kinase [Oscillospiraceae bacterium]
MKHLFIVNPIAGGHDSTPEIRSAVQNAFQTRSEPWEVYVTAGPMDATKKIITEASTGEELRIYACGGDGTFNECVGGAAMRSNVSVCPYPIGTGNDFCRSFGDDAALFRDLDAILDGTTHVIDLISCNGRYGAGICSVGIDARVGTNVHRYSKIPLVGKKGAYIVSVVAEVFKGIATQMHIRSGSTEVSGKYSLVCVCNGRYYGGGFNPSPDAKLDDGLLDIYIVKRVSLPTLARLIGDYAKGKADLHPEYITHLRGTDVYIDFDEENVINLDGEAMHSATVNMHLIPEALNLILPKGLGSGAEIPPITL